MCFSLQQEAFETAHIFYVFDRERWLKRDFINRPRLPISIHPEDNKSHALLSLHCKVSSPTQRKRKTQRKKDNTETAALRMC